MSIAQRSTVGKHDLRAALAVRFQDLLIRYIRNLRIKDPKATGSCPLHPDRRPSFSADLEKCVFHCFACGQGGGVKAFAALVGEPWTAIWRRRSPDAHAHGAALVAARQAYKQWTQRKVAALTDRYRMCNAERAAAEAQYRLLHRQSTRLREAEAARWIARLGLLYDTLALLEWDLDILTYCEHEPARFQWWQEDTRRGRIQH